MHFLEAVGTFVDVGIFVVPDRQVAVVGHWIAVFVEGLEPCLTLFRATCIELAAQLAASHIVGVGANGFSGLAGVPVSEVLGVEDNGATVIAADDVAAFRADVHPSRHEAVRDDSR